MRLLLTTIFVLATIPNSIAAERTTASEPPKAKLQVFELTVHPAELPRRALEPRLLPSYLELTPGNAAPVYGKALIYLGVNVGAEKWDKVRQWLKTPLDSLPRKEVREMLESYSEPLRYVEIAARRERCEWDPLIREEGRNVFGTLLPEVQSLRVAAYLVALQARLQIAEKDYDEALASLRTGYAVSLHVAELPYLVSALIAGSIEGMVSLQLRDLISQPEVPNMYWAITALPSPPIDVRHAIEFENAATYLMFPEMEPSRRRDLSPAEWKVLAPQTLATFADFQKLQRGPSVITGETDDFVKAAMKATPHAKTYLISAGYPEDKVEAMVPGQAVVLAMFDIYEVCRDDLVKWQGLPYHQTWNGLKEAKSAIATASDSPILTSLSRWLLTSLDVACCSEAWHERTLAALRCVEAIRLYAATHEGKLPPSLDAVQIVPVPINPMTGEPFGYCVEGDTAVIDADGGPDFLETQKYRVRVAK